MNWTTQKPTASGWYWWRETGRNMSIVLLVDSVTGTVSSSGTGPTPSTQTNYRGRMVRSNGSAQMKWSTDKLGGTMQKYRRLSCMFVLFLMSVGCTSVGSLGIVTRPSANNAELLKSGVAFEELGPAEGKACRHFILAIIPFGDSTFSAAVEEALAQRGGDALLNVTVSSSLYGFIPIYNVYSLTCTAVQGIAVKFKSKTLPSQTTQFP